jgi:hypothetical protein
VITEGRENKEAKKANIVKHLAKRTLPPGDNSTKQKYSKN